MQGKVVSVSRSGTHSFLKIPEAEIRILAGLGVEGDAHAGRTVRHRYLVKKNPNAPNLQQVHLLGEELFGELRAVGIDVRASEMGENITTSGLDLLALPLGTRLHLGAEAIVELTGLRTPCFQMNKLRPGLMQACLGRKPGGRVHRKAGVMSLAVAGGLVRPGDSIRVELPAEPHIALGPV